MKIVFICGSLEPGRDGVGDYTRRLSIEMIKQGNQVAAIALKDWHLENIFTGLQYAEDGSLQVLRLPAVLPSDKRFEAAQKFIDEFEPSWLSLQFVNFAFHFKGFHIGLGKRLQALGKGRHWHIMFHELWVGMAANASKKHVLWGKAQKILIRQLIKKLKPEVVTTQSQLYEAQLEKLGLRVAYLPLFSNIPVKNKAVQPAYSTGKSKEKKLSFVIFGSVHPMAPIKELVHEMKLYSENCEVSICVVFIGRSGKELDNWLLELKQAGISVKVLGEQPPEEVSAILAGSDIGISTSSLAYIEKSGTVVAMLEHGLPVICVAEPIHFAGIKKLKIPYGITEYKIGNLENCIQAKFEFKPVDIVTDVSKKLLCSFSSVN